MRGCAHTDPKNDRRQDAKTGAKHSYLLIRYGRLPMEDGAKLSIVVVGWKLELRTSLGWCSR